MVETAPLIATAQRLITENGRSVTFIAFNKTSTDANRPWKGSGVDPRLTPDSSLTVDGVFVDPTSLGQLGRSFTLTELLKRAEQILLVSPGAAVELSPFQEVLDGGEYWKITSIQQLKPGADTILYYVGLKR